MSLPGAVSLTKVAVEGEGTATPGPPPLLLRPPQPIGGRLCPRALPRGVRTLSARPSRCSHCSHFSSSSSFLAMHSRYLACIVAMPSSTSCRRCFASSRILCVTSRSSWASRKACCGRRKRPAFPVPLGEPRPPPLAPGLPSAHPLGLHGLGHKVVLVHGAYPLADGGAGLGHLGNGGRLELLIVDVWLDGFDHCLPDVVLGMGTMGLGPLPREDGEDSGRWRDTLLLPLCPGQARD